MIRINEITVTMQSKPATRTIATQTISCQLFSCTVEQKEAGQRWMDDRKQELKDKDQAFKQRYEKVR